jgi:hypothetical protein
MGVDAARAEAERLARQAVAHLEAAGVPSGALGALADILLREVPDVGMTRLMCNPSR